jgi:hypothetical protein
MEKETLKKIEELLYSNDEESYIVGLTLINNCDIEKNLLQILLIKRKTNLVDKYWNTHAPNFVSVLKKENLDIHMNLKDIFDFMKSKNEIIPGYFSEDKIQIFTEEIETIIKNSFTNNGALNWVFIEDIKIKIKI